MFMTLQQILAMEGLPTIGETAMQRWSMVLPMSSQMLSSGIALCRS